MNTLQFETFIGTCAYIRAVKLFIPLFHRTSLLTRNVPDSMKIAEVTALFKSSDRPIK